MKGPKTLDSRTSATRPGCFLVDVERLRNVDAALLDPHLRDTDVAHWRAHLPEHMLHGDTQPALVVSSAPHVVVACYSDDLDACVFLRFAPDAAAGIALDVGTRLVTVNTYARREGRVADDIVPGPDAGIAWGNFAPVVAHFVSRQPRLLERRVRQMRAREWRALDAAIERHRAHFGTLRLRDGRPTRCQEPALPSR